jgi:hypothetical protein
MGHANIATSGIKIGNVFHRLRREHSLDVSQFLLTAITSK